MLLDIAGMDSGGQNIQKAPASFSTTGWAYDNIRSTVSMYILIKIYCTKQLQFYIKYTDNLTRPNIMWVTHNLFECARLDRRVVNLPQPQQERSLTLGLNWKIQKPCG